MSYVMMPNAEWIKYHHVDFLLNIY